MSFKTEIKALCGAMAVGSVITLGLYNIAAQPTTEPKQVSIPLTTVSQSAEKIKQAIKIESKPLIATTDADQYVAQTMWGEARGCSRTQQAAVAWCIYNRVADDRFPDTVQEVVTQKNQFDGYNKNHQIDENLLQIAREVRYAWEIEQATGVTSEDRVLPAEYLYFHGDGEINHFTLDWREGSREWDWTLDSPYAE